MSTEDRQKPQNNASTGENGKADWDASNADTNGILAINIEGLRRPEEDHGKEIGTANKSDDQGKKQDARCLL